MYANCIHFWVFYIYIYTVIKKLFITQNRRNVKNNYTGNSYFYRNVTSYTRHIIVNIGNN